VCALRGQVTRQPDLQARSVSLVDPAAGADTAYCGDPARPCRTLQFAMHDDSTVREFALRGVLSVASAMFLPAWAVNGIAYVVRSAAEPAAGVIDCGGSSSAFTFDRLESGLVPWGAFVASLIHVCAVCETPQAPCSSAGWPSAAAAPPWCWSTRPLQSAAARSSTALPHLEAL
jgi:hypothetical protein